MPPDTNFAIEQYKQTNDHLRETDRKRDVMLGVYVTASAALYGLSGKLEPGNQYTLLGALGLTVVGILLSFLFTAYRYIHGDYMIQIAMMSYYIHHKTGYRKEDIKSVPFSFLKHTAVELWPFSILQVLVVLNASLALYIATVDPWSLVAKIIFAVNLATIVAHIVIFWWYEDKRHLDPNSMWVLHTLWGPFGRPPRGGSE